MVDLGGEGWIYDDGRLDVDKLDLMGWPRG
jgi:hypothetical protein